MANEKRKVSTEQLNILIEEIEKDHSLVNSRNISAPSRLQNNEKWTQLAKKLNAVENGAVKNIRKWQQTWRDWKSNIKKKSKRVSRDSNTADESQELTCLETRVLDLFDTGQSESRVKGIDISKITEIDPLLSDSSNDSYQNDSTSSSYTPTMLTVYTAGIKGEKNPEDDKQQSDGNTVRIKRRRICMTSNDPANQTTEILTRLDALESCHSKILNVVLAAVEKQAEAAIRLANTSAAQAQAMMRIVELLEKREKNS